MKNSGNRNIMAEAVAGSIFVVVLLIVGTLFTGRYASRDTKQAVRNVSLIYLDELAGRREQVLNSTLNDYIADMDVAIGLLTQDDLSTVESLQEYQLRMKQLYGIDKFAFVDEDGLIYTSRGTRTDIDQYDFDYRTLSAPEISVRSASGENIKIVIAVPTDRLPFNGHHLVVCFMEMNMDQMLENISFQSGTNNTTFCNIYTRDGYSLTNMVLGGLASEDNLLLAMEQALYEDGYSVEELRSDFLQGKRGVISFTYGTTSETLYYVPIRNTDWMLTYLIRESVIGEQIDAISDGIVMRSLIMSVIIALVMIMVFITMIIQFRKSSKLAFEKETSEMMQQELEERIALQDELLKNEKKRSQLDSMFTALAADYRSVYYVNLDEDQAICFRNDVSDTHFPKDEAFSFSELFTQYANKYITEDYREQFLEFIKPENIRAHLNNSTIISCRYLVRKDNTETYEMLRMADVNNGRDNEDKTIRVVGVGFTDIDEEMRDSLSKSQALGDALKTAEAASKAKTNFLSNMSHEIRTPMNAIIGLDALALNDPGLPETTKDYLEKIGSSAKHLLGLINDILDMSRIESGTVTLKEEEFAFFEMTDQINMIFKSQCQEKGLTYSSSIDDNVEDYYIGDRTKISQILINILGNAVKFTPEGGRVELNVSKSGGFHGRSTLQFRVNDTGVGMSEEYLPKLFDTFSQEGAETSNKYGSTGLGMAITKRIVEMMNGEISVKSEKNKGTTFVVSVTLLDSDRKKSDNPDSIEIVPQNMKVLVVDDDPIACDQAKLVLSKGGINAYTVSSGQEAIDLIKINQARQEPFNLIIMDWKMPQMDGIEATRQIRSFIGKETAIIIITAYDHDDIYDEAMSAGVDSFVAKPIQLEDLIRELKDVLKKRRTNAENEVKEVSLEGKRILMAEDMEINAEIMTNIMSMWGIHTDHATNGEEAVKMFEESEPGYYDAILMDIRMPKMNGLTAGRTIRASSHKDALTIPIIALTANAFDEDVQQSLQAGLNAHLSKPVEPDLLLETLQKLIKT